MEINGHKSIEIDGQKYWTVKQFALLTERIEGNIRHLMSVGNRIRKIQYKKVSGSAFIYEEELFNYPFIVGGRPSEAGIVVLKYKLKEGDKRELISEEEILEI